VRTVLAVVIGGVAAGAGLGVIARGWMRLLAEDPDFTTGGTVSIIVVFGLAGLGHAVAHTARARAWRRGATTLARVFGAFLTLPLFGGAGVVMFPTVLGASLAVWRPAWPRAARALAILVAVPAPLWLVAEVRRTGVAPAPVLGLVLLAATYALIVWSTGSIVAPDVRRSSADRP
jgi:hypothetical protein